MGSVQTAEWYDARYAESVTYARSAQDAPWAPLWARVAEIVGSGVDVADIGCGAGHLASILTANGCRVTGLDFSRVALEAARERAPLADFRIADIETYPMPRASVYVACEVLEHIDCDLDLIGRMPRGALFVGTVPTFDDTGHVRHFANEDDVRGRYGGVVDIGTLDLVGGAWWLFAGRLKT